MLIVKQVQNSKRQHKTQMVAEYEEGGTIQTCIHSEVLQFTTILPLVFKSHLKHYYLSTNVHAESNNSTPISLMLAFLVLALSCKVCMCQCGTKPLQTECVCVIVQAAALHCSNVYNNQRLRVPSHFIAKTYTSVTF